MATSVTLNGVSYSIPAVGEGSWGTNVSNYLVALSTGTLSKAGGSFTLTGDADFGASFGLKSIYYKSRATASTAGVVRLGNDESIGWRNAANSGNKLLKVNSSNQLEYDGTIITPFAALTASRALVSDGSGIPSVSATTAIELGYVSGVTSAIQTQLNGKQASGSYVTSGGALGTPSSGNLSNCTSYPNVTQSVAGLVASAGQLLGTNTNDSASAGRVGETFESGSIGTGITVTNTPKSLGDVALTAGHWLITATAVYNGSAGNTNFQAYIGTTVDSSSGTTRGLDSGIGFVTSASGVGTTLTLTKLVKLASPTTHYLSCETSTGSAGSGGILGSISAIRIR